MKAPSGQVVFYRAWHHFSCGARVQMALLSVLAELGFRLDAVLVDLQHPLRALALKPFRRPSNGATCDEIIAIPVLVGIFVECCERLASE